MNKKNKKVFVITARCFDTRTFKVKAYNKKDALKELEELNFIEEPKIIETSIIDEDDLIEPDIKEVKA